MILLYFGSLRHLRANKKRLFQASVELELTTFLDTVVSLIEHCCLEDFGMPLKSLFFGINAIHVDGDTDNEDTIAKAGASGGTVDHAPEFADNLGGFPDPGHLFVKGP